MISNTIKKLSATLLLLAAAGVTPAATAAAAANTVDYDDESAWLCRPDRDDFCQTDMSTTVVMADGSVTVEPFRPAADASFDCFYVYPTVSRDTTANSDIFPGPGEISVVRAQFARFASVCRPFAPLYRQVTLTALRSRLTGGDMKADRMLGYNDVKAAWEHYLANDNKGRGVVLVGHSQGSGVLTQLIRNEIDGKPVQQQIISAMLIGTRLAVPAGKTVGGDFQHMPLCTSAREAGCVVTFASFRSTVPPPPNSLFGKVPQPGMVAGCTNPADLSGQAADLHAYLSSEGPGSGAGEQAAWARGVAVNTPFVSVPGLLSGRCVSDARGSWLEVTVNGDPTDPRTDDISGDVISNGEINAGWGLHLIDVHLVMGDLIRLAQQQAAYWSQSR